MSALLANVDSHRDADVRSKLAALADFAERRHVAVVIVAHLNKNEATKAVYRVGGSIGFVALARSVLLFGRDPDSGRRLIVPLKNNLAALGHAVEYEIDGGTFRWGTIVPGITPAQLFREKPRARTDKKVDDYETRIVKLVAEWRDSEPPTQSAILSAIGGNRNRAISALATACERRPPRLLRHGAGVRARPFWYECVPPSTSDTDKQMATT